MWEDSQLQSLDISRAELSPEKSSVIEALRAHSYRESLPSLELLLNEISNFDHFQSLKGRSDGNALLLECLDRLQYEFIPRGRFLFHYGDIGEKLYFIVSGVASVLVPIPQPEIFKQEQSYQLRTHWCGQIDRPELSGYERELAKSNYQRARKAIINFQDKYEHPRLYKMLQESPAEEKKAIMTRYFHKTNQTLGLFRQAVELHENSTFGEASLIGQRLRTASVFAVQDLHLFSIKGRFYMDIFNPSQVLSLNFVLKNLEKAFTSLTKKQLINLSYLFERVPTLYNLNQVIFKDGQDRNYIYLIRSGSVAFKSVRGISLGIISEGEFFGCENKKANAFRVLLSDKHCFNAYCSATNTYLYRLDCHLLESEEFEPALGEFAEMGNKKADYYARRAQHCQNIFQQIDLQVSSPGSSVSGMHDELAKQSLGDTDLPATGSLQKALNAQTSVRSLMSKIQIQKKFLQYARQDSSKENPKEDRKQQQLQFNMPEITENISMGSGNDFTGQFDEQQQQYIPQRSEFQLGDGSNSNSNLQSTPKLAQTALKGSGLHIKASQHRVSASNEFKQSINDLPNAQAQSIGGLPHPSTFSMIPGSSATLEQIDLAQPTSIIYPQQSSPFQAQPQQQQPPQQLLWQHQSLAQLRSDQDLSSEYLSQQSDGHLQFQFISKKDFNKTKDTLIKEHDKLKQRKPQTYLPQEISELPLSKIIAKKLAPMIHSDSQNKLQEITPQNAMSQEQKRYLKQSTNPQLAQQIAADTAANLNGNSLNTNYNSHLTPQHQIYSQSLHANSGAIQHAMSYQTSTQFHKPNTACIRIMNMAAKSRERNNLAQKDKNISVLAPSISFLPISGIASSRRKQQVPLLSFGQLQQGQDSPQQQELGSLTAKDQTASPSGFALLNQHLAMTARQKSNERSLGMQNQQQFQVEKQEIQSRKETTSREREPEMESHQFNGEGTAHNSISNISSIQTHQPKRLLGTAPSIQRILEQSQRKSEKLIRSTNYIIQGDSPSIDQENHSSRDQIASACGVSHPCYSARTSIQNSGEKPNRSSVMVASRLNLSSIQTTNNQNHVIPGKLPLSYTQYQASKTFTPIGSAVTATTTGGFSCSTVSGFATTVNNASSSVFGWNSIVATSGGFTVTDKKQGMLAIAKTDIGTPIDNAKPSLTPRMDRFSSTFGTQRSRRYKFPSQSPTTDNEDSTQRQNRSRNQHNNANSKASIFNSSLKKNPVYQTLQRRSNESKQLSKKTNMLPFFIADKSDQYNFMNTPFRSVSPGHEIGQNVLEIINSGSGREINTKPTTATCLVKKRQKMILPRNLSIEQSNQQQQQQQYPSILVIDKYQHMKPSTAMTPNSTNNLLDAVISYPNSIKIEDEFNYKQPFSHELMYDEQKGLKTIFQHKLAKI